MARKAKDKPADPLQSGSNSAGKVLSSLLSRIENVDTELDGLRSDKRDIFAEAKGHGFDTKIMRIILRRRAMERAELAEQDALVDVYANAVGDPSPADADTGEAGGD